MKVHKLDDAGGGILPLTPHQQQAIDFIGSCLLAGFTPTIDQLQQCLGIPLDATAELLGELEQLGLVRAIPSPQGRAN